MSVEGFDWDDANVDHVRRHGVEPDEAADALADPNALAVDATNSATEKRWAALGATEPGRLLFVVFTRRDDLIRIITSRDAKPRETRRYKKSSI